MNHGSVVEPTVVTHYDLLGVEQTASATEVQQAYRRAAREAHPDRHGERSAPRMADINEAWRVLGNPDRRHDYDAMLDLTRSVIAASSWAPPTTFSPPAVTNPVPRRFGWRFVLSMELLAVTTVVATAVLASSAGSTTDRLRNGDCVVLVADRPPARVACATPHDAVVERLIPFGRACPEATVPVRNRTGRACVVPVQPVELAAPST